MSEPSKVFGQSMDILIYGKHLPPTSYDFVSCHSLLQLKLIPHNNYNDDKNGNNNKFIIPRARMGSESIAHEAEGQISYWIRGHEGEKNKIQLVGQKYRDKTTLVS